MRGGFTPERCTCGMLPVIIERFEYYDPFSCVYDDGEEFYHVSCECGRLSKEFPLEREACTDWKRNNARRKAGVRNANV